ncbi:ABC transporter substrate-binding protein [Palleronia sp. KMU-117]|uniref:ABC transporter substrate-binding protein n=1 Tax=Palleronia sp. KMU-117 TaxID=3434108 RepID=UPI003D75906D
MAKLTLSLACTASDRTRPILDGRVSIPGVEIIGLPGEPEEIFRRALRDRAFDITELSMASHITTTARGDSAYVGVPVFPSRAFRHSGVFVNAAAGIAAAEDLKGRRIGLPEYQQTAAMWMRGILAEHHGIAPSDVEWVVGSQEVPGGTERVAITLPDHIRMRRIAPTETLNGLLASGEIDALITPRPPSSFLSGTGSVVRLWPDYRSAEIAFYKKSGFFPIMHCIAIRRELAQDNPWLPVEIFRAFSAAKAIALDEVQRNNFLRVSLPWIAAHYDETVGLMGADPWPYGFGRNQNELDAMTRFAHLDGLTSRPLPARDLFHPSTLDLVS